MPIAAFKHAGFGLHLHALRSAILVFALMTAPAMYAKGTAKANWFPDQPSTPLFTWTYKPCDGCTNLQPEPAWIKMAGLAGLKEVHFLLAPDEANGQAYSYAPNAIVVSPSALKLMSCQLAFIVGHELAHIAQRHFDEDAMILSVLSGRQPQWTHDGEQAMHLLDDDFLLALRMSPTWQQQERDADWMGTLLAANGCGCTFEESALPYLRNDEDAGGGIAASHGSSLERLHDLEVFGEAAKRLAARAN